MSIIRERLLGKRYMIEDNLNETYSDSDLDFENEIIELEERLSLMDVKLELFEMSYPEYETALTNLTDSIRQIRYVLDDVSDIDTWTENITLFEYRRNEDSIKTTISNMKALTYQLETLHDLLTEYEDLAGYEAYK